MPRRGTCQLAFVDDPHLDQDPPQAGMLFGLPLDAQGFGDLPEGGVPAGDQYVTELSADHRRSR